MKLKSTQRKSLATVPTSYQGQERRFAQSVSESLDVLTGRRGDIIDRAVTFRDLIDTGVLKLVKSLGTGGGSTILNPNENPTGGPTQLPTQPENLTATGGFGIIFLNWTLPPYRGHDHVEIYRLQRTSGAAEPTLVQAEEAGVYTRYYGDLYQFADTNVGSQENWYYWIRAVNIDGIAGPFYSTDGVDATTALDYLFISGLIDDILDDDQSNLGLKTEIDKIDAIGTALGTYNTYTGDAVLSVLGAVADADPDTESASNVLSALVTEVFPDGSNSASSVDALSSTINDPNTGLAATATLASSLNTTVTGSGGHASRLNGLEAILKDNNGNLLSAQALHDLSVDVGDIEDDIYDSNGNLVIASASSVLDLQTEVYNTDFYGNPILNSSKIQQNISSINGIEAKYSVKIDNNGHVSGFGLVSTTNDHPTGVSGALPTSTTSSAFIIAANRFAVGAPYNANSTADSNVGTNYPFKVLTEDTYLQRDGAYVKDADGNSVLVPAGVYIDDAFIHTAQITEANIGQATITSGHIYDLSATRISSGNIAIDNSNNIAIFQGKRSFSYYDTVLQKNIYVPNFTSTAAGFALGNNNGTPYFHIGNATHRMEFNGSTLEVTGASITNLSVSSLKIQGEAVTAPRSNSGSVNRTWDNNHYAITSIAFSVGNLGGAGQSAGVILLGVVNLTSSNDTATSARLRIYKDGTLLNTTGLTWRGDGITGTVVAKTTINHNGSHTFYLRGSVDTASGGSSTKSGTMSGTLILLVGKR